MSNGIETTVAVDQYGYKFDAGRVVADTSATLRFKAVYANVITLKLKAPATAQKITYLKETAWNQNDLIFGAKASPR